MRMKKILLALFAVLCLAGCSKERIMQGKFSTSLAGSTLYLELLPNNKFIAYFEDESDSDNGSYFINGDIITAVFYINHGRISSYHYRSYAFTDGTVIDNDMFTLTAHELMNDEYVTCTFLRRK